VKAHDNRTGNELVEQLRTDELESLRSEVGAGRREHILRTLDQRGIAQELIRQQYTGRYPFELLQNADDAAADTTAGTVRFHLTDDALIVADQGSGFGTDEIRAICGLGRSSKDPRKAIGYKGLGFKSVGEITERPEIISSDARFRFDEQAVRSAVEQIVGPIPEELRLPVYAFPFELRGNDLGEDGEIIAALVDGGFRSVLRFPFKDGVTKCIVESHLHATLTPRLLLLLGHTERLEVTGTSRDFAATVARDLQSDCLEVLLDVDGSIEHWLVFSRQVMIPEAGLIDGLGDTWKHVERVGVSAAVRLDDDGRPSYGQVQPLHVYFPTVERSGLPLILHGDFALELDRRHVSRTPEAAPYNEWLADQLADLVATTVAPLLSERFPGDASVVAALAPVGTPSDFGESAFARIIERLASARFIPAIDGRARLPGEVALLPDSIPDAAEAHRYLHVAGLGRLAIAQVEDHAPSRQLLTTHLQVTTLRVDETAVLLVEPAAGNEQAVYEFLLRWAERCVGSHLSSVLTDVPCVRTMGGGWAAPAAGLVFGRKRGELDLPDDLGVPIVDVPEVPGLVSFLQDAGVRPFEWRQLLPEFVLPLLTSRETDEQRRRSGFRALRAYYESERSGDPRVRAQISRVLVPASSTTNGDSQLRAAGDLYFSVSWLDNDRLERIYGPFDEPDFVALEPPVDDDERRSEFAFLEWVGVAARPRIDTASTDQRSTYLFNNLARHPHHQYGQHWVAWTKSAPVTAAEVCDQGHSGQQLRLSFAIDRFDRLVAARERERLAAFWQALVEDWPRYEAVLSAEVSCPHGWHTGARARKIPSLARYMLTELEWLPCFRAREPSLARPRSVWRLAHDTPRRIAERVDVISPELATVVGANAVADSLGVVDAARPDPVDLVSLLDTLADEHATGSDTSDIFEAARWAMRTLDDVLDRGGQTPALHPRFLAKLSGQRIFHESPMIALDPLLEETWEPDVPILDADRDLRRLHRAFKLRSLDNEVVRFPGGELLPDVESTAVRARIDKAKPYLAALAAHETPSRQEDVFRGLARLEVIVYSELRLRYELDGLVRTRDEAVSYLAVRQQKTGRRRNIGTAHLEIDSSTGEPHWFVFGPQLAQFLSVPTQADAFALLLESDRPGRERFLTARRIDVDAVEEARIKLDLLPEDDMLDDLVAGATGSSNSEGAGLRRQSNTRVEADEEEGTDGNGGASPDDDDDRSSRIESEETPLPPIDFDRIQMVDGSTTAVLDTDEGRSAGGGSGLGPAGPVDFAQRERVQRRIGRRGEEAAYAAERQRLENIGFDPNAVIWRADRNPYAPFDIESLDEDGQRIFIEVKSTTADDPGEPFEISEAELRHALKEGERYFVYRVTETHTARPTVTRYEDPLRLVRLGHAEIRLSGARLAFHAGSATDDA